MFQNRDHYIGTTLNYKVETVALIPIIKHDFILLHLQILQVGCHFEQLSLFLYFLLSKKRAHF